MNFLDVPKFDNKLVAHEMIIYLTVYDLAVFEHGIIT